MKKTSLKNTTDQDKAPRPKKNIPDDSGNVTEQERELLQQSSESTPSEEEEDIQNAAVDNLDEDGMPLNERVNRSGSDLDVPGSEEDDLDEEIGEEDEENNSYSLPD